MYKTKKYRNYDKSIIYIQYKNLLKRFLIIRNYNYQLFVLMTMLNSLL